MPMWTYSKFHQRSRKSFNLYIIIIPMMTYFMSLSQSIHWESLECLTNLWRRYTIFNVYERTIIICHLNENSFIFLNKIWSKIKFEIFSCSAKRQKKSMTVFILIFIHWEEGIILMGPMSSKLNYLVCLWQNHCLHLYQVIK